MFDLNFFRNYSLDTGFQYSIHMIILCVCVCVKTDECLEYRGLILLLFPSSHTHFQWKTKFCRLIFFSTFFKNFLESTKRFWWQTFEYK